MTVVCQKRLVELITGANCLLWSHPTASFDLVLHLSVQHKFFQVLNSFKFSNTEFLNYIYLGVVLVFGC